jgi:CO/xanthine dehydrogenase FAD-binding subunit
MINPHPGLPEFEYVKLSSLQEASQFLAQHAGESRPLSGGTDIFVRMRDGAWKDKYLVDVKGLDGAHSLVFDPQKGLSLGLAVNMNQAAAMPEVQEHYPLLAQAARSVASYQLRNRATIVGNVCNASPAGDTVGACLAYEGVLHVHGVEGERSEPLSTFFKGPGLSVLKPGDIVTAISFPLPPQGHAGKYIKLGRNALSDLAIVGATALGYPDKSAASGYRFRIYLASVAPTPARAVEAEAVLTEKPISAEVIVEAAQAAMDACKPIDDVRGSARYRQHMVRNMVRQSVTEVWNRIHQS